MPCSTTRLAMPNNSSGDRRSLDACRLGANSIARECHCGPTNNTQYEGSLPLRRCTSRDTSTETVSILGASCIAEYFDAAFSPKRDSTHLTTRPGCLRGSMCHAHFYFEACGYQTMKPIKNCWFSRRIFLPTGSSAQREWENQTCPSIVSAPTILRTTVNRESKVHGTFEQFVKDTILGALRCTITRDHSPCCSWGLQQVEATTEFASDCSSFNQPAAHRNLKQAPPSHQSMSVSAVRVSLQPAHGYIPLVVIGAGLVGTWAGFKVTAARKKYNVPYPQMYAEKKDKNANEFNCVQRAHQNVLENLPLFYATLATASIYRPKVAAAAGVVRIAGFIMCVKGYSTGDPGKRRKGSFGHLGALVMLGLSFEAALRLLGLM